MIAEVRRLSAVFLDEVTDIEQTEADSRLGLSFGWAHFPNGMPTAFSCGNYVLLSISNYVFLLAVAGPPFILLFFLTCYLNLFYISYFN